MFASDKLLLRSAKRGRERKVNRNDICLDIKIHNYTYRIRKAVWGLSPVPGIVSRVLSSGGIVSMVLSPGGLSAGYCHRGGLSAGYCHRGVVIGALPSALSARIANIFTVCTYREKKVFISRGEEQVDGRQTELNTNRDQGTRKKVRSI